MDFSHKVKELQQETRYIFGHLWLFVRIVNSLIVQNMYTASQKSFWKKNIRSTFISLVAFVLFTTYWNMKKFWFTFFFQQFYYFCVMGQHCFEEVCIPENYREASINYVDRILSPPLSLTSLLQGVSPLSMQS